MGRKPKACKQPLATGEQPSATAGNPSNLEPGPLNSDTSHTGKRKSKASNAVIRRSQRLHHSAGNQDIEPVVYELPISDSENDKEETANKKQQEMHALDLKISSEQTSDEMNFEKENPGVADIKYKTMYINSQKKIEALMEENKELNKALEHAVGKIDVYEKQSSLYGEVMNVIASLSKVNENLSTHVKRGPFHYNSADGVRYRKKKTNEHI
ncbi:uncharacterized protein LOC141646146 [Silene latifolia]|uniref:uncharacterized protein LOC141646146 n=1 Tax=Silene latifolia TaxID=37657 RepID=UPI003D771C09